MAKILLYYKYIFIEYPERVLKWQRKLCTDLELKGRIIIAHEGINGTVGGSPENIELYKIALHKNPLFNDVEFKESQAQEICFPKMRIVVKNEIVNLGLDPEKITAIDGGTHLTPAETHSLIAAQTKDLVILDARNNFESRIGAFKDAIIPDINHFRELPSYIDNNLELFKDKDVLMYCTGGVRCERASTYLKSKGITKNVYQIKGGIHTYAEQFPDGFFRGKNYVFDGRLTMKVNDDILGTCGICSIKYDDYTNCLNASCNKHFICCPECLTQFKNACGKKCMDLIENNEVEKRPMRLITPNFPEARE